MPSRSCIGLTLIACALSGPPAATAAPAKAQFVGSYVWRMDDADFGGWSGFDLYDDALHFRAISDRGHTISGVLERAADGHVTGVAAGPIIPLLDMKGKPVDAVNLDAEGLALGPGDSFYASFEIAHRIVVYPGEAVAAGYLTSSLDFRALNDNEGFEALARSADGALYAIPELPLAAGRPYPVYRLADAHWTIPFHIRQDGYWHPVGADFGPDGRLYVLERDYWGLIGFMSRMRRFTIADGRIGNEEILFETHAGVHDNLEGLAVWRDTGGAIRLTMISDDNFVPFQQTQIVDYRVTE